MAKATVSTRSLPVLAIALIAAAGVFLWGLAATPAYADEPTDIGKIVFDGDSEYDWAHFYNVENKDATLSLDNLKITVQNEAGEDIEPDSYELTIEHVYYSEEAGREVGVPVDLPIGIWESDKGEGFTRYRAIARDKEDPDIFCEGNFVIMDRHSLNFYCADISFEQGTATWYERWRMHDRYWFNPGTNINCIVRHAGEWEVLREGDDYEINYYRVARPEDMDNDDVPIDQILVANDEFLVTDGEGRPAKPTEPGSYFARIKGINNYYGENDVLVDIDSTPRIVFRSDGEHELWSDDTLTYRVQRPDGVEGEICFEGGVRDGEGWELYLGREYFQYDPIAGELTVNGSEIFEAYRNSRIRSGQLDIRAWIQEGQDVLAEGYTKADLREAICDYGLPEDDNILPEWDGWIDKKLNVWIQNKDYPYGRDFECEVTDLNIVSENGDLVLKIDEDEKGWNYRGIDIGTARLQMTYTDINGDEKTHEFDVNVSETVYYADVWAPEGVYQGLPGTEIDLEASAEKHTAIRDGDGWRHDSTSDGLNLSLSFEDPDSTRFAEMEVSDDPAKATVYFKDIDEERIDERIGVRVGVTDEESTPSIERASNRTDLFMRSEYHQIYPATIDGSLDVGKSTVLEPEVRFYRYGHDGYSAVEDPRFTVEDVDPEAVEIDYDAGDNCLYIFRKADRDTNFNIRANFDTDDGGNESIDQWYHLDRKNYRIEFEYGDEDIYSDQDLTVKLNKEDLDSLEPELVYGLADDEGMDETEYAVKYTVGVWNDEDEEWDYKVPRYDPVENLRYFEIDRERITFYGENLENALKKARNDLGLSEDQLHGFNVRAELIIAREYYGDTWFWVNFRHKCEGEHKWITSTIREKTCIDKGRQVWICLDHPTWGGCGQVRWFDYAGETDDFGPHALTKIPAKESTLTATGNIEHYKCKVCDKLFRDSAGENEISQADTVIAKKINISGATIAKIPNKTYNKKAQKPALTVKYGSTTLKSGTDYTATYANNVNAGTAKVTVTGKGKYAGTKATTFVIAKANNTMTLKAKKVTVKYTAVKKANQKVKRATACTMSSPQGKVTWKKASGNAKITVASNGVITVKKGLKKGTYKVGVKATAAGNANYKAITKSVKITIIVK